MAHKAVYRHNNILSNAAGWCLYMGVPQQLRYNMQNLPIGMSVFSNTVYWIGSDLEKELLPLEESLTVFAAFNFSLKLLNDLLQVTESNTLLSVTEKQQCIDLLNLRIKTLRVLENNFIYTINRTADFQNVK